MKNTVIIQARMKSKRLPNKVMALLAGKPAIYWIIERIKKCKSVNQIVVATTNDSSDDDFVKYLTNLNVAIFRGNQNNLLDRYYRAALFYHSDNVIRITADNPLVFTDLIDMAVRRHIKDNAEFTYLEKVPKGVGLGSAVLSMNCLVKIHRKAYQAHHLEHIVPYVLDHPKEFRTCAVLPPQTSQFPNYRLTMDFKKDYDFFVMIFRIIKKAGKLTEYNLSDIIKIINNNKIIYQNMIKCIERSKKS